MATDARARWHGRASTAAMARADWLGDGVLSGFAATFGMTVVFAAAYGVAAAVGTRDGALVERWLWALVHNPMTRRATDRAILAIALSLLMGLTFALGYSRFVEPALSGPGWRKGMIFAMGLWVLSIVAFLPIMGGGSFGVALGAGPLPILGNLIVHLVYGAILGSVYALDPEPEIGLNGMAKDRSAAAAERGAALGIAVGVLAGSVAGWMLGPKPATVAGRGAIARAGGLIGAEFGASAGLFLGMARRLPPVQRAFRRAHWRGRQCASPWSPP